MLEQQLLTELHCKRQHSEQLLTELTEKERDKTSESRGTYASSYTNRPAARGRICPKVIIGRMAAD